MNILKKNIKLILLFIICFLISSFILSGIYYFLGFSKNLYLTLLFFINLLIIYIFSLKIGKIKSKESILNSIIFPSFIILIIFILNIIFFIKDFSFQNILYYIIILTTSILGIFIGRRKKVQN